MSSEPRDAPNEPASAAAMRATECAESGRWAVVRAGFTRTEAVYADTHAAEMSLRACSSRAWPWSTCEMGVMGDGGMWHVHGVVELIRLRTKPQIGARGYEVTNRAICDR